MLLRKIGKLLNLGKKELPRVIVAWSMMFLMRFGFIVGWSVLIATFLSKVGMHLLPALFLANAILVMIGTRLYRPWVKKVRREILIIFTALAAATTLVASIVFMQSNVMIFFLLLLGAESVLLSQLQILISLFNEDLFTPLESQRTFPIIESAETIGAITGGLILGLFANWLPAYKFILIWAISALAILPIVLLFNSKTLEVPKIVEVVSKSPKRKGFSDTMKLLKKVPFLKGLMIIVLLHWGLMNIIEYQYTKAIQQDVFEVQEETLVLEDNPEIELASFHIDEAAHAHYEQEITKKLGTLHALFNGGALFIQLLIASRLIQALGVVPSMFIHPLIAFLTLIGMTLRFNFMSAVISRGAYEITGLLFKNSYDSSYYAIPNSLRDDAKELMQGIIKPLGAILGTAIILLTSFAFEGPHQTIVLNAFLIIGTLLMGYAMYSLKTEYTKLSEHNLSKKTDLPTRLNAIEILAQNGHTHFSAPLLKILRRENESEVVKINVLKTLGERKSPESINAILDSLNDKDSHVRYYAAKALKGFSFEEAFMKKPFTAYHLTQSLTKALEKERKITVQENLVRCLYKISPKDLTNFLLEKINSKNKNRDGYIRMLHLFNDPNLKYFLAPFLKDRSAKVRAASIITLWQFKELHDELTHYLTQMFNSKNHETQLIAVQTCGDIKFKKGIELLKKTLKSKDEKIVDASYKALGQLGDKDAIEGIIARFADPNHHWHNHTDCILKRFPYHYAERIRHALHHDYSKKISEILEKFEKIDDIDPFTLKHLRNLYKKLNAHHEAHQIKLALDSGKK